MADIQPVFPQWEDGRILPGSDYFFETPFSP
jgi:hypothetical protein